MAGEHLAISNYDQQSEEEVVEKLRRLSDAGVDIRPDQIREYEEAREEGSRQSIISTLDELTGGGEPAPDPGAVSPGTSKPVTAGEQGPGAQTAPAPGTGAAAGPTAGSATGTAGR